MSLSCHSPGFHSFTNRQKKLTLPWSRIWHVRIWKVRERSHIPGSSATCEVCAGSNASEEYPVYSNPLSSLGAIWLIIYDRKLGSGLLRASPTSSLLCWHMLYHWEWRAKGWCNLRTEMLALFAKIHPQSLDGSVIRACSVRADEEAKVGNEPVKIMFLPKSSLNETSTWSTLDSGKNRSRLRLGSSRSGWAGSLCVFIPSIVFHTWPLVVCY